MKEFIVVAFNLDNEIFVVYIIFFTNLDPIYPFCRTYIVFLKADKALLTILSRYINFANVFSMVLIAKLSEYIKINNYIIKLLNSKQPFYRPILSQQPVKLEMLKTYIKINLTNSFIRSFKSSISASILCIWKHNDNICLYGNDQGLNIWTIKNQHLLPLINAFSDQLDQTKCFTQLNLISAYHQMRFDECNK